MSVRREIEIDASPEEVWEALVTQEGRERWLEEPDRDVHIEVVEFPYRLVWWWGSDEEPATRVEFEVVAIPAGARVNVTESAPGFPIARLCARFEGVFA